MEITPTATTPTAAANQAGRNALISSDFKTFLTMLTTQMKNQDPLNPIESSDYAVQLATFSGVEQQMKTNQLLGDLGTQFSLLGMSQLAGWVGQDARVAAPIWYDGSPVTLSPNPSSLADRAVLVVKDASGNLMAREDIDVSAKSYDWLGGDVAGDPLPDGKYTLSLENWAGDQLLGETPVEYYAQISEARGGLQGTSLILNGGIEVKASAVTGLRAHQP